MNLAMRFYHLGANVEPYPVLYFTAANANNSRAYTAGLIARLFGVDLSMTIS